jgi:hypothetical protein
MSKTVNITIDTDNAAFGDTEYERYAEIARILRAAADRIDADDFEGNHFNEVILRDVNGNRVGALTQ